MSKNQRRRYTTEFKQQAVELAKEIGDGKAESKLGIVRGNISNWRKASLGASGAAGELSAEALQAELKQLKAELVEQRKINTILKAAAAFFSQDHLK